MTWTAHIKKKHFIGKRETAREDNGIRQTCLPSEANGHQNHSDVVGTAPPHCLTGQLLAGRFKPQLFISQCWLLLYTALLLHWGRRLGRKEYKKKRFKTKPSVNDINSAAHNKLELLCEYYPSWAIQIGLTCLGEWAVAHLSYMVENWTL